MSYYLQSELKAMGFKKLGQDVKISRRASIYDATRIVVGDHSRIDDFCVVSGRVEIGRNVHITPQCLVAGGTAGVFLHDFSTVAYGVKIFSQSDDYLGGAMTNSTIPKKYVNEFKAPAVAEKFSIIGAGTTVLPGVTLKEGTSVGAMSLVTRDTEAWGVYAGVPARRIKGRSRDMLKLYQSYMQEEV